MPFKDKESRRAYEKAYREDRKETLNAYLKAYREKDKEKHKELARMRQRTYAARNLEVVRARTKTWRETHPDAVRAREARKANELTPSYVAHVMRMPVSQLTPELLELKREQLALYRLGKQLRAQLKEMT